MNKQLTLLASMCLFFAACSHPKQILSTEKGVSKNLAEYRKAQISNLEYQLYFDIPEGKQDDIKAKNTLVFDLAKADQDLQIDFREDAQKIHRVVCNGKESAYRFESEHLIIPKEEVKAGANKIQIDFTAGNTSLNRNDEFLYTLFVPDRARTAFPCFDQPDLKAAFSLRLQVPNKWTAVANGKLEKQEKKGDKTIYQFAKTKALPTYLFSFVAGKFESITHEHNGREYTMYHRETDQEKLSRNSDEIFEMLFQSLDWMEKFTGVPYPFAKYDFIVIPSFQYGGMEHTGATLYSDSRMFLDKEATQNQLLARANLIAHETAHMWFGDLVTMKWFDQVWLKEVFANFLADKITNPNFPEMNHKLKFQMAHFPSAYSVDRSSGANPINQVLPNLKDAGTVYGSIIYHKAPIVMDMLEKITGEDGLRKGLQHYLKKFAYKNASWEDLITILDETTPTDLKQWSKVWVDRAGRPHIHVNVKETEGKISDLSITQSDAEGKEGHWNQKMKLTLGYADKTVSLPVELNAPVIDVSKARNMAMPEFIIPNGEGNAYGFFELDPKSKQYLLDNMHLIQDDLLRGIAWINLYENLREGKVDGKDFVLAVEKQLPKEQNSLILERMLSYLKTVYWLDLSTAERKKLGKKLESSLFIRLSEEKDMSKKASLFSCFANIAESPESLQQLYRVWKEKIALGGYSLSETKATSLACNLAIKMPAKAAELIETQIARIENPDRKKKMQFVAPALSADLQTRNAFFESLKKPENREIERWVLDGLHYLNHPLRQAEALKHLPQELEMLQEIQITGDIFFPYNWLSVSYSGLNTKEAGEVTRNFLNQRPDYPKNLQLKILQAADLVLRK